MGFRRSGWALAEFCLAWMLMLGGVVTVEPLAHAQAVPAIPMTLVSDTIYAATGGPASGTALISWPAFSTWAGASVQAGSTSVTIGSGGTLSVPLVPNAGSTPMGSYYTAVYHMSDGSVTREYWVVPVSTGSVAVSSIKSTVLPASVAMQTVSKAYVDTAVAAAVAGAPLTSSPPIATSANINTSNTQVQVDSVASSTYFGLDCFGDSYLTGNGATAPAFGQCALVGSDLNIGTVNNFAVPGDTSGDLAYHVFTSLNPGDTGNPIVIAAASANNVGLSTAGLPNFNQNTYAAYAWGSMSSTNKVLAGASGVAATGTTSTDTTFASANGKLCSAGPCTFTYSAVAGSTGVIYLWYDMRSTGGSISVTVDGAAATDTVTNSTSLSTAWTYAPTNNTVTTGMARYVTTPGTHTIVVTAGSGSTVIGFGFPSTIRNRGVSYPRMFMGGTAKLPSATLAATQVYNSASIAVSKQLVADGLNVPFVDLLNAYNLNLDFSATAAQNCPAATQANHPNNCGHRDAAGVWEASINAVPTPVSVLAGGALTVGSSLYVPASDGAVANPAIPSFWQMPSHYTDTLIPKLDFASTGGCNFGVGQGYDTTAGLYGTMLYGCSGKAIQFAYADPLTTASTNANFHVSDYISLPDGNWHGTGAFYTGAVTVGTATVISGSALTVNGLTSGNGWSNGFNTTPIYNYGTAMGSQPGASNDQEIFTTSAGTVSLGQLVSGTFTPWATAGNSTFNVLSKRITNVSNAVSATDAVPLGQLNGPIGANITLTAATTDSVTMNGVTSSSKCSFSASNATAAGVASSLAGYYTVATNSFTLHHVATTASGATYGVICTLQ